MSFTAPVQAQRRILVRPKPEGAKKDMEGCLLACTNSHNISTWSARSISGRGQKRITIEKHSSMVFLKATSVPNDEQRRRVLWNPQGPFARCEKRFSRKALQHLLVAKCSARLH
eukprot:1859235-Amphidinium_carterae.2